VAVRPVFVSSALTDRIDDCRYSTRELYRTLTATMPTATTA
jgi:hypothetical protein